ncbi:methyltransferase domain-containing protein [uncultured Bradyrhizobium sp.]|uniref:methyltransferase domain-containing protein n=1 Tax=uncultured Bradyrhizobium sp. TaxID=199684 RepID=UPI0035CC4F65
MSGLSPKQLGFDVSGNQDVTQAHGPGILDDIQWGTWRTILLDTAIELDVFSALYGGPKTLDDLGRELKCAPAALAALLDALCGQRLLGKQDGRYRLSDAASAFLARQSPAATPDYYRSPASRTAARGGVAEIIRHGDRRLAIAEPSDAKNALMTWRQSLAASFSGIWARLGLNEFVTGPQHRLLDLGCGAGIRTLMLPSRLKHLRMQLVDRKSAIEVAENIARQLGIADRVDFAASEIEDFTPERDAYDTIFLGSVINYFGPEAANELLRRLFRSLRNGGRLVLFGPLADDARCSETLPLLLDFQFYVTTPDGRVYTPAELFGHLGEAGFIRKKFIPPMLIEARKPDLRQD